MPKIVFGIPCMVWNYQLFAFDSCYTREHFAFDSFEKRTTTGRNIRYFVSKTEFVYTSYGVTTANERECTGFCSLYNSVCDSAATGCESVKFEYSGGTVP